MKPMEAWHIISTNMMNLYRMRKNGCFKGYTEAETEAEVICFLALREAERRENRKEKTPVFDIPDKYVPLIKSFADSNMRVLTACKAGGYTRSGAEYALDRIHELTGLDPRSFRDLVKLLEIVEGGADNE